MRVYFVGVFLVDLVLDLIPAQFIELMGWDLDKVRDGGLGVSVSSRLGDFQGQMIHTRMNMARRARFKRGT
jgi:hypothetical protein